MRYLSWFCSILLHTTLIVILLQTIHLAPLTLEDVMEVDLAKMEMPKDVATVPVPQPMTEMPPDAPEPVGEMTATPLPLDETVVLDDSPPAPPEPMARELPLPAEPTSEIVEISPVKVPVKEEAKADRRIMVRKDDFVVHRGHEARFGRTMAADYYSYSATEFSGQFTTKDDRTISIIDARNTKYGRFLIYDSKNKTLRRLKQFGKYVYTIGPSVYEDEPVVGSVTFLAKNDRIERFILMTDDDRMAHYPRKVHVREDEITIPATGGELKGQTSLPPVGDGHPGVVFVYGNQCTEQSLIQGFTRSLSARNLASLWFTVRGCEGDGGTLETDEQLVADTNAAMAHLVSLPQIGPTQAGIWGNGAGVPIAIRAATTPDTTSPAYMICLLDDALAPDSMPGRETLSALSMPTLWIITGRDTTKWQPFIAALENLRDVGKKRFSIIVAPLKASQEVLNAKIDQSGWVESVAEDHARLAVSWIRSLNK